MKITGIVNGKLFPFSKTMEEYGFDMEHCSQCYCKFDDENICQARLDFGLEYDAPEFRCFCSAKCLMQWMLDFAMIRWSDEEFNKMLAKANE